MGNSRKLHANSLRKLPEKREKHFSMQQQLSNATAAGLIFYFASDSQAVLAAVVASAVPQLLYTVESALSFSLLQLTQLARGRKR